MLQDFGRSEPSLHGDQSEVTLARKLQQMLAGTMETGVVFQFHVSREFLGHVFLDPVICG